MFPCFSYENDKPMSKLVGGLALSTWCRPSTASRSLMRRRMRALRLGQPGDFRVMKWVSLATKSLELRLPLLKNKQLHVFLDPIFIACDGEDFCMVFDVAISKQIWGDLLGFAIVTSGYISQWTDQPCPLGRMHQRLPCLGKRWQTRKRDGRRWTWDLGTSESVGGFGGKKYVPNDDLDGWGNML